MRARIVLTRIPLCVPFAAALRRHESGAAAEAEMPLTVPQVDSAIAAGITAAIQPLSAAIAAAKAEMTATVEAEARERATQLDELRSRYTVAVAACHKAVGDEANAARQREQAVRREADAAISAALVRVSELERETEELKTSAVSEEQVGRALAAARSL